MAEEDVLWGFQRHLFGGIGPSNMLSFTASVTDDGIELKGTLPNDTVIENQTLCSVAGCIVRKSETTYPKNEFDGEFVLNTEDENFTFTDTNVESEKTYYYSAFPYTDQKVFNRNKKNRCSVGSADSTYIFGYDLDLSNSDPDSRVSYPSDVDNANYTPAYMDFSSNVFQYGSWSLSPGEKFMPKPCMLASNGIVSEYLNPNNYSKTTSGSASQYNNTSFDGNAMMQWAKIYTHREEVDGVYKFRCSNKQVDSTWECWCNYDKDNNLVDNFYTPIYFGSEIDTKLRSISGQSNSNGITFAYSVLLACKNGDRWYIENIADRLLINDLLIMISKSTNSQDKFGKGASESSLSSPLNSGTMDDCGMFWGSTDTSKGVKVFGMENYFGNISRNTAGIVNDYGSIKIKATRGDKDGSTSTDYSNDGTGYIDTGYDHTGTSGTYFIGSAVTDYGLIPYNVASSGTSSTYECDEGWVNTAHLHVVAFGGDYTSSSGSCGIFHTNSCYTSTESRSKTGASLSYK